MRTLALLFFAVGGLALAQSRTISTSSGEIQLRAVVVTFRADGGCLARPVYDVANPDVSAHPSERVFNGPRCAALRQAAQTMAELDQGVDDGGVP